MLESIEKITSTEDIKLVLISFPHNPTTLTVDLDFYNKLVHLGQKRGFWIVNDFAYSDVYFDDKAPPSLLQSEGAIDNCIELYSLTKGYSMAGWRVGFAIGNEKAIGA